MLSTCYNNYFNWVEQHCASPQAVCSQFLIASSLQLLASVAGYDCGYLPVGLKVSNHLSLWQAVTVVPTCVTMGSCHCAQLSLWLSVTVVSQLLMWLAVTVTSCHCEQLSLWLAVTMVSCHCSTYLSVWVAVTWATCHSGQLLLAATVASCHWCYQALQMTVTAGSCQSYPCQRLYLAYHAINMCYSININAYNLFVLKSTNEC